MTDRRDVNTTLGLECGCCGHRHAIVEGAGAARNLVARAIYEEIPGSRRLRSGQLRRARRRAVRRTTRLDLRVVATTNRFLDEAVSAGRFRRASSTALPPRGREGSRSRRAAWRFRPPEHYMKDIFAAAGSYARLAPGTVVALRTHGWSGNVRERRTPSPTSRAPHPHYGATESVHLPAAFSRPTSVRSQTLAAARAGLERSMVRGALDHHGIVAAAGELGLTRQGLSKLMARLDRPDPARDRPGNGPSRCRDGAGIREPDRSRSQPRRADP